MRVLPLVSRAGTTSDDAADSVSMVLALDVRSMSIPHPAYCHLLLQPHFSKRSPALPVWDGHFPYPEVTRDRVRIGYKAEVS
jgi:hypothetical protein